jgi:hypothetical protein
MSKKLIAVASAAALALTALVGVAPANATAASIAYDPATGTGTSIDPYVVQVPEDNTLVAGDNALEIAITNLAVGDTATVSISGTAKVVDDQVTVATSLLKVNTLGSSSLSTTLTSGTTADFYVYGTSTAAASTITISITETDGGTKSTSTVTKYFKPSIGAAHFVTNANVPATMTAGTATEVSFNITDVFGNVLDTATIASAVLATAGPTVSDSGIASWDTVRKIHVGKITAASSTSPFVVTLDGGSEPTNVGLGASNLDDTRAVVNSTGVAAQVTALTAQVTALTADYNALAKKWNARVASKTAPKKKVVLK